jgi:hypothetical protein
MVSILEVRPSVTPNARVSRVKSKKKNEPSTGGQVAICRLRLADLDLPEGKVLVDPGRSAWNPAIERPAWDELRRWRKLSPIA